ncbi:MAG: protein kinase [Gemmatimonadaceae bacterium]
MKLDSSKLGPYEIVEQIGAGGMGVVYRARDPRLDRDVAIKVLPAGLIEDDASRVRLRREAHALAKLSHPNIATLFDVGEENGISYLVAHLATWRRVQTSAQRNSCISA